VDGADTIVLSLRFAPTSLTLWICTQRDA
jgi:hypothetical protein